MQAKKLSNDPIEISKGIEFALYDELNDRPMLPRAYGSPGWLKEDRAMLVYDRYDIWQLDPSGAKAPICLTQGHGRAHELRFRYQRLDSDERAIDPSAPIFLSAFDSKTKASGFYVLDPPTKEKAGSSQKRPESGVNKATLTSLRRLIMLDEQLAGLRKARDTDQVLFTRSTFRKCPDLWSSNTDFQEIRRVSDMNPHQVNYTWGDAELVHWQSADGQDLDGILLKPDGLIPQAIPR